MHQRISVKEHLSPPRHSPSQAALLTGERRALETPRRTQPPTDTMGKTSKFTFPIPGKKQKPGIGPIVSGPMSKAQKILGTAELNIDAPQWDDMSNSGISISISESTATTSYYTNDRALQTVGEEEEYVGKGRSNARWELESETVPAYLRSGRNSRLPDGDGTIRDLMSETSSLRRRQSNSTLRSWYDKAKMPLSISQQTSASAMAKGLPSKASALLDVDTHGNTCRTSCLADIVEKASTGSPLRVVRSDTIT
ncbi:hypothetical protein HYQ44_008227 [Verticillium longisporum]|nr:hypothetical protein HYQ44_008227 [Verticillium longisporum]